MLSNVMTLSIRVKGLFFGGGGGGSGNAEFHYILFKEPHVGLSLTSSGTQKSRIVNLKTNFSDLRNFLPKFYQISCL